MSGTAQNVKATYIRIPNDFGGNPAVVGTPRTQNDFGTRKIATATTHSQEALDNQWSGAYVAVRWFGGTAGTDYVDLALTKRPTGGEVDRSVVATNNTAAPPVSPTLLVGARVVSGDGWTHFQLPEWDRNEYGFLLHESSASGTLILVRTS